MLLKLEGIVVSSIKYSETSIICKIFTDKLGLQSFMINGVRSAKNANKAILYKAPNVLELEVYHQESKKLKRIKEAKRLFLPMNIQSDILKTAMGIFLSELMMRLLHENYVNEIFFDFLLQQIKFIDQTDKIDGKYPSWLLMKSTDCLGFSPEGSYREDTPYFDLAEARFVGANENSSTKLIGSSPAQHLSFILNNEVEDLGNLQLTAAERNQLFSLCENFLLHHVSGFQKLKSPEVLNQVLNA